MHPEGAKLDGKALFEARRTGTPVGPLTGQRPGLTVLTSRAMQTLLGVDQPDFAPVLASMVVSLRSG